MMNNEIKSMLKDLGLSYRDVATITGLTYDSVKSILQPNAETPRWMKLSLYIYKKLRDDKP